MTQGSTSGQWRYRTMAAWAMTATLAVVPMSAADGLPTAADGAPARAGFSCGGHPATVVGTSGPDVIRTRKGNDVIVSLGSKDIIDTGAGNDWVCAGDGNDVIHTASGVDHLFGGGGHDTLDPGRNRDVVDGGTSGPIGDTLTYASHSGDLVFHAAAQVVDDLPFTDHYSGIEIIQGGQSRNTFWGTAHRDTFIGGPWIDVFHGGAQDDRLFGGEGNDYFYGGHGDDLIDPGSGVDRVKDRFGANDIEDHNALDDPDGGRLFFILGAGSDSVSTADARVRGSLGGGGDLFFQYSQTVEGSVDAGEGNDVIYASGSEGTFALYGGVGHDRFRLYDDMTGTDMYGGPGADALYVNFADGGEGHDVSLTLGRHGSISAPYTALAESFENAVMDGGDDTVLGSAGANVIWGMSGDDTIDAGGGDDDVHGGAGTDTCLNAETVAECEAVV